MRISDWSSDVCSSDLKVERTIHGADHIQQCREFAARRAAVVVERKRRRVDDQFETTIAHIRQTPDAFDGWCRPDIGEGIDSDDWHLIAPCTACRRSVPCRGWAAIARYLSMAGG